MVQIIGYGEDALTLWALQNRLEVILGQLDDSSDVSHCRVFYRPSFGRGGHPRFGEFDFIILAERRLYLGESKWHRPPRKLTDRAFTLHRSQKNRHRLFRQYVKRWACGAYSDSEWARFESDWRAAPPQGILEPPARDGTLLADNLQTVLGVIREHYKVAVPEVIDVLLLLHQGQPVQQLPGRTQDGFVLVPIDYGDAAFLDDKRKNFIVITSAR